MAERKIRRSIETDLFGRIKYEKTINSKKKGDKNERLVSKWLGEWVGKPFTRVPSSGGLRWQGTANVCGDVVCEDADFNFIFSIETKHLKSVPYSKKLRKNSMLYRVWGQCVEDANRSGRIPMVVIRENGMRVGDYIILIPKVFEGLLNSYEVEIIVESELFVGFLSEKIISYEHFITYKERWNI